jgi:SAM-dependent methyltransferase
MARDNDANTQDAVIDRYSGLARIAAAGGTPIDGDPDVFTAGCFGAAAYPDSTEDVPEAALRTSLGCGNPLAVADLQPGEIVLDLGSGGGLDVVLSARRVAPGGLAYGLDGSVDMLALARANAARAGVTNVRFVHGCIEAIPLPDQHVDVIISNCVINLSASKERVLAEAYRVLRPGGRVGISDMVAGEGIDLERLTEAEQRAGCISGTLTMRWYRSMLDAAGFDRITITKTHPAGGGVHSAIIRAAKPPSSPS